MSTIISLGRRNERTGRLAVLTSVWRPRMALISDDLPQLLRPIKQTFGQSQAAKVEHMVSTGKRHRLVL